MNTIFIHLRRLFRLFPLALLLPLLIIPSHAADLSTNKPGALLKSSEPLIENFMTAERWEGVRNLTGVARAVIIIPGGGQAGFILGGQWGKGFLLVRHGMEWSDPVFVKMGAFQFGLLIGGQKVGLVGAVLTDSALERILAGKTRLSGTGDLTVGLGVSGRAAGSGSGGIEVLTISTNKGVYLGGSIEGLKIWIDQSMNQMAYGNDYNLDAITGGPGGNYQPAMNLRAMLSKAAKQAVWGDSEIN